MKIPSLCHAEPSTVLAFACIHSSEPHTSRQVGCCLWFAEASTGTETRAAQRRGQHRISGIAPEPTSPGVCPSSMDPTHREGLSPGSPSPA